MTKPVNERELVLAVLMEINENGRYSHIVLRDTLAGYQFLDKRERAFITRVTEGTVEHLIEIDYIIDQFSKVKTAKMKPVIRNLLRSAVYQLKYMDSIPARAVCSESVRIASRKGFSGLKGFVNGVLRNIARGLDDVKYPEERTAYLSVRYSCPVWIIELWKKKYSLQVIETMLKDFQEEKPTSVRCCLNKTNPEELKARLEAEGVKAEIHPYIPYVLLISGYDHLDGLETFQSGMFMVQDPSSVLVGELADPPAGARVIDVCAAPGGKALHMAEILFVKGRNLSGQITADTGRYGSVEARDLTEYKTELIRENIDRSGLPNISAVCRDASIPDETSVGTADVVIADLPCSGLGVLGKKTDLKYRASEEKIKSLVALQRNILSCTADLVKPEGVLMYSTCTVNPAENEENVNWFLENFPQFEIEDPGDRINGELRNSALHGGCIQLLPGVHMSDGFFIARLRRKSGK